jgi:hypothetical protein
MAEASLSDQAIAALDEALRTRDPISRMMLIEQAVKLHRQSLEASDADRAARSAVQPAPRSGSRTQPR